MRTWIVCALLAVAGTNALAVTTVSSFAPHTAVPVPNQWMEWDIRAAGTASIVDLTGLGGSLEADASLPTGAALLTTGLANADKAEVGIFNGYGSLSDVLPQLAISYDYYKQTVVGGSATAAPSLKLGIVVNGSLGYLVYEPTWNQAANPGASLMPPADEWVTASVDYTTGLWWTTGLLGQPNSYAGPPVRTLSDWDALFQSDQNYAQAQVAYVGMGVGTYNQGQVGYFDNVDIAVGNIVEVYDFEAAGATVPEPATMACVGMAIAGLAGYARRRRTR